MIRHWLKRRKIRKEAAAFKDQIDLILALRNSMKAHIETPKPFYRLGESIEKYNERQKYVKPVIVIEFTVRRSQ